MPFGFRTSKFEVEVEIDREEKRKETTAVFLYLGRCDNALPVFYTTQLGRRMHM
jgi:hypothetical protein